MPRRPLPLLTLLLLGGAAACAGFQPHIERAGPYGTLAMPPEGEMGPFPDAPPSPASPVGRAMIDRVCRAAAVPAGWVAIGYSHVGDVCPRYGEDGDRPNGATIERHANRAVGTLIAACADQRNPRGWSRRAHPDGDGACADARVPDGSPTRVLLERIH